MAETARSRSSSGSDDDEAPALAQDGDAPGDHEDTLDTLDTLKTVDLETALAPRHQSGRRRSMRTLLALAPFLALAAIIFYTIFGQFPIALLQFPFGQPSDAQPVVGVAQKFTITSDVNYGTITLNGKQLTGALPLNVTLPPGYDTLTLSAAPFNPIKCEVLSQYEPVIVDNGQASENSASCAIGGSFTASSLYSLYMPLTGDDLAANLLTQARGALAQALTQAPVYTATVPPGQYYVTGVDRHGLPTGQRATEPLQATLSIVLPSTDAPGANPIANPYDCPSHICSALTLLVPSFSPHAAHSQSWRVAAAVALRWRFTTADGRVVGESTEDAAGPLDFTLAYDPRSGWQVSAAPPSAPASANGSVAHALDPCALGDNFVTFDAPNLGDETVPAPSTLGAMRGCLFQTNSNEGATGAHYLYRFGVVLAADAAAHATLPSLPLAPPDEIAAVAA